MKVRPGAPAVLKIIEPAVFIKQIGHKEQAGHFNVLFAVAGVKRLPLPPAFGTEGMPTGLGHNHAQQLV
jgi:hypothetical protein